MAAVLTTITNNNNAHRTPPRWKENDIPDSPRTPKRSKRKHSYAADTPSSPLAAPLSPVPAAGTELHQCLVDFLKQEGTDFTRHETVLAAKQYTPAIIPAASNARLAELTGAMEGTVLAFQLFCKEWNDRLGLKKRRRV